MLIRTSIAGILVAVAHAGSVTPVRAAEAFLCEKDRVVYVETAQLEDMKRTDPCIASYFGIKLAPGAAAAPAAAPSSPNSDAAAPLELKTLTESTSADRFVPGQHGLRRTAALQNSKTRPAPPVAAPGTDFRNVRVLNASDGDSWFRHAH